MLEIKNLHARIASTGTEIIRGLNLTVKAGEVAAIMGPNGSGKSTLSYILAGREDYEVTEGDILFDGHSILEMDPAERATAGIFLAFQTQRIPTDEAGNAAPGAKALSEIIRPHVPTPTPTPRPTPTPSPTPPSQSLVYMERALINPSGEDPGREVVVLASLATTSQTLNGWRLVDKNGRATMVNVTLGAGQSVLVTLDGTGAQLGNQGGNLVLQNSSGIQIDAVTYTSADAGPEGRYVRFRR